LPPPSGQGLRHPRSGCNRAHRRRAVRTVHKAFGQDAFGLMPCTGRSICTAPKARPPAPDQSINPALDYRCPEPVEGRVSTGSPRAEDAGLWGGSIRFGRNARAGTRMLALARLKLKRDAGYRRDALFQNLVKLHQSHSRRATDARDNRRIRSRRQGDQQRGPVRLSHWHCHWLASRRFTPLGCHPLESGGWKGWPTRRSPRHH
jgi:hypothetical protein